MWFRRNLCICCFLSEQEVAQNGLFGSFVFSMVGDYDNDDTMYINILMVVAVLVDVRIIYISSSVFVACFASQGYRRVRGSGYTPPTIFDNIH